MPTGDYPPNQFHATWITDHQNRDWNLVQPSTMIPIQENHPVEMIPFNYPVHNLPDYSAADLEAILSLLRGVRQGEVSPDPITANPSHFIDRVNPPERPITIQFSASGISIYEEDANGSRHLRYSIQYDKLNTVMVVSDNKLITAAEAHALDLVAELRSTQASLFDTAEELRKSRKGESIQKDAEVAILMAQNKVLEQKMSLLETEKVRMIRNFHNAEAELVHIKQQIVERKKAMEHLTLEMD